MYGKKRIGITRDGIAFIAGKWPGSQGGSHQNVGRIVKNSGGKYSGGEYFRVYFYNWKFIGTAKTKTEAKIIMFNAAKNHKDYIGDENVFIDEKGKLYRATR